MGLYLWINILIIAVPLLLSFGKKVRFFTHLKTLFPAILIVGSLFLALDIYFTDIRVWSFNPDHLIGISFFNLPIEECLFFLTIPYAFVFLYENIKAYFPKLRPVRFSYYSSLFFTISAVVLAIVYRDNWFTLIVLLSAGVLNWIVYFGFTPRWYPYFIVGFLIAQFPLFIVNGVLAGSGIDVPVIWYNESEIIGIRTLFIPLEIFYYQFTLLFSVVLLHEYLRNLWEQKTKSM
ncbi:MAG TPA: lycopene cyclase domain-containing protein [Brumimicrobium sp.]|nr:lycopene cyclase domain-containing protein [Brumimicrobium sp.]